MGLTDAASVLLARVVEKDKEKEKDQDKDQGKGLGKGDIDRIAKSPPVIIAQKKSLVESIVDMSGTADVIKTLAEATTVTDADVDTKLYKNLRKTDPVAEAEAAAAKRRRFEINLTLNELSTASVSNIVEVLLTT